MFQNHQRGALLKELSHQLDMDYSPTDHWGILHQLGDIRLFRSGFQPRIRHVLSLEHELMESRVHIFDYRYLLWAGKSTRRVEQTVFFIESRQLGLPEFYMQPERFFHKIGEALGLTDDIDFETHLDFSNNYRLTGDDDSYIRYHFNEKVLRFFSIEKGWTMEGLGFYLVLYKKGKKLSPRLINEMFKKGLKVYDALSQK